MGYDLACALLFTMTMKSLLTLFLLAATPALPTTITYDTAVPRLYQNINFSINGTAFNINAGQIGVQFDGITPGLVYCADPLTWLVSGPVAVTPIPDSVPSYGGRLAWLFNNYNPTFTQGWQAAGFQLAVWEIVTDGNDDLGTGIIQTTASTDLQVIDLAKSLLDASAGQSSTGIVFWVPDAGPSFSQTLFSAEPAMQTPEPGTFALMGAGCLLLGMLRSRRR